MDGRIAQVRDEFLRTKEGLSQSLATTPNDRLLWSPSPTARSPLAQAAHAAWAIGSIHEMIEGRPFASRTTAEADAFFREWEKDVTTREAVEALLEAKAAAFVAFLDGLTPDRLERLVDAPFGLGQVQIGLAIEFPTRHTQAHIAQIQYIQTIYGDHDWYLPNGR